MMVRLTADTLAFGDLVWLAPEIPRDGGGRFDVTVSSSGGSAPIDIAVRSADLHAMRSRVTWLVLVQHRQRALASHRRGTARGRAVAHRPPRRMSRATRFLPRMRGALHATHRRAWPIRWPRADRTRSTRVMRTKATPAGISRVTAHGDVMLGRRRVRRRHSEVTAHAIRRTDHRQHRPVDATSRNPQRHDDGERHAVRAAHCSCRPPVRRGRFHVSGSLAVAASISAQPST